MKACPRQGDPNPAGPGGAVGAGASPPAPSPGALGRRGSAAWQSALPAGEPPTAAPIVVSERPAAAPRAAPRGAAAVEDATHRVSSVNAQGVCVKDVSADCRQYTWSHLRESRISSARLDRIYCFKHHFNIYKSCTIIPAVFTDHFGFMSGFY